jgi:hypothetical protein
MASKDGERPTDEEEQGWDDCSSKMIPKIKIVLYHSPLPYVVEPFSLPCVILFKSALEV